MSANLLSSTPGVKRTSVPAGPTREVRLQRFLQAYWLRPENALWMTLRSLALREISWTSPGIDICCGDGIFTFLHGGGALDPDFDVFTSVRNLDCVTESHADMFDHVEDSYKPPIVSPPRRTVEVGTDHKTALLAKAKRLDLYDQLVRHDANHALPFDRDAFQTVYCNAAYWVKNIALFLSELARITAPAGRVILQVKLDSMKDHTLNVFEPILGSRFLEIIGRGRIDCWPTVCNQATWEKRFRAAGLTICDATPLVTRTHAHFWDVGLRPIAPMLVKMTQSIAPAVRASIKKEWVALFHDLLLPLCNSEMDLFADPAEPGEIQYVLSPA